MAILIACCVGLKYTPKRISGNGGETQQLRGVINTFGLSGARNGALRFHTPSLRKDISATRSRCHLRTASLTKQRDSDPVELLLMALDNVNY